MASPMFSDALMSEPGSNTEGSGGEPGEGVHFIIYISVGVCSLLFLLVLFLVAIIFCWHRAKLRRQMRRLMSDNSNSFSYNSTLSYEQSLRHSQRYSSFGTRKPLIFILYALELGTYKKILLEEYPTYSLVLHLTNVLYTLNLPCYHDGSDCFQDDSMQDFSSKVCRAVREARVVVVVCSQVLSTALCNAGSGGKKAQMKFGKFSVSRVRREIMASTGKFISVTMTGISSIHPPEPLGDKHCYNLQNHEEFLSAARGLVNGVGVWTSAPQFSEFSKLAMTIRQLLFD